ncbi:uncharacterized protein ColSpa_11044 [Colletotrichum spaethianum]|uniref:Uncharacterized protein n=1 Tax=Colletotrichum spaethianum TaxID=700344 RepID=A0AA37PES0_9PEZI|nr:uncharacterized protein ColSpa_11044 [Colletotrichum spaethianum]GKT50863.1 hypothetical protein ColSpa_11044 [Colletotrichum spaethianum]
MPPPSVASPPPILAITATYFQLLAQHLPRPVYEALRKTHHHIARFSTAVLSSAIVVRAHSLIPHKMRRPLGFSALLVVLFLIIGLPVILAQSEPFHCYPYPSTDTLASPFITLQPHCCKGPIDNKLRVGNQCEPANGGVYKTKFGQDLGTCATGWVDACCMRLHYPPEIERPDMSYCDAAFLVKAESKNIIHARSWSPARYGR